ncbi:MAG TPA: hypothetical protein VHC69_28740 [Polyangiaceae bacterium]|nr:hypothetical protein [Polyangiaceae bacterium]
MGARKSRHGPRKRTVFSAAALPLLAVLGCDPSNTHELTVVDGADTIHFSTTSAFAEYVELPGEKNELRITLASYPLSCEHWDAPKDGQYALSVTIVTPAEQKPAPASYPWTGLPAQDEPLHEPYALPKMLLGSHSRVFEPGGAVRLSAVGLDLHASVVGALALEYPGDGNRPATRVDGGFEAKICRSAIAAH